MKKALSIFLVFILFSFSSCTARGKESAHINTNAPFTCTAQINYDSLLFECRLTFRNAASASLEFLEPSEVAGLVFELTSDGVSAKYKGLSFSLPDSAANSAANLIFSSLSSADSKTPISQSSDQFIIKGELSGKEYSLVFDSKSGELKALYADSLNFKAEFKNFKYLD